jgi:hypothetical protein
MACRMTLAVAALIAMVSLTLPLSACRVAESPKTAAVVPKAVRATVNAVKADTKAQRHSVREEGWGEHFIHLILDVAREAIGRTQTGDAQPGGNSALPSQ